MTPLTKPRCQAVGKNPSHPTLHPVQHPGDTRQFWSDGRGPHGLSHGSSSTADIGTREQSRSHEHWQSTPGPHTWTYPAQAFSR